MHGGFDTFHRYTVSEVAEDDPTTYPAILIFHNKKLDHGRFSSYLIIFEGDKQPKPNPD
jgi:hypothetical protein